MWGLDQIVKTYAESSGSFQDKTWSGFVRSHTQDVWGQLEPLLDSRQRTQAQDVLFAPVPSYDFNGIACRLPSGETVIGISISTLLMWFADIHFFRALGIADKVRSAIKEKLTSDPGCLPDLIEELLCVRAIARCFRGSTKLPETPYLEYSKEAEPVWGAQYFFIITHEIGHVCLGHLDRSALRRVSSDAPGHYVDVYQPNHEMEYEADHFAVGVMSKKNPDLALPLGSLFALLRFVEDCAELYASAEPNDPGIEVHLADAQTSHTHPAARLRFDRLKRRLSLDEGWYNHLWALLQTRIHLPES